jgi:hypothetical protein
MRRKKMKHFASEEWVDFVNKQLSPQQTESMQRHLEAGCQPCSKLLNTWNLVKETAQRESDLQVPESAIQHVLNAFVVAAEPKKSSSILEIPRLVFDSLWQPALAGVRSGAAAPRHLLYRAGEVSIELVLEPEPPSERVHIAGQVSSSGPRQPGFSEVPIVLHTNKEKVVEATTNRLGEFHLGFVPQEGLRISLGSVAGRELTIPLDGIGMRTFLQH